MDNEIIQCDNTTEYYGLLRRSERCLNPAICTIIMADTNKIKNLCSLCRYIADLKGYVEDYREKEKRLERLILAQTIIIGLLISLIIVFIINY